MKKINLHSLSITYKLVLGLCFFLVFVAIFSVLLLSMYRTFEDSFQSIEDKSMSNNKLLTLIDYKRTKENLVDDYFLTQDPQLLDTYTIANKEFGVVMDELMVMETKSEDRDMQFQEIPTQLDELGGLEMSIFDMIQQGDRAGAQELYYGDYQTVNKKTDLMLDTHYTLEQATLSDLFFKNKRVILSFQIALAFFLILIPVFLVIYTFLFTTFVAATLKDLADQAHAIAGGDFSKRVKVETDDEVGELATAFNEMADELSRSYSNLEEKVREKTQALSGKVDEMERQNHTLEETKTAMLNILEDLEGTKALVEQEKAKDEIILANIGDGILYLDAQETVVLINQQAERMCGTSGSESVGKKWFDVVHLVYEDGSSIPLEKHPLHQTLLDRKQVESKDFYIQEKGVSIPVFVAVTPIFLKDKVIGVLFVLRDISKDKEVQRMKNEFISLASHQLRTPLTAMKWFTEMLLAGDAGVLNAEQKDYLQNISASNDRMVELVEALLKISRLESGRIVIEPKQTNIGDLLQEVLMEIKPRADQKTIKIAVEVQEGLPEIMLDQKLVRQVFSNLLTNSIKYTKEKGEVLVRIVEQGEEFLCEVTDNGVGIPKDEQNNVFNKFYRGKNIELIDTDGTGLGLYLVKLVVQSSGGRVWFKSEENEGTSFWFTLPKSGLKRHAGEVQLDA